MTELFGAKMLVNNCVATILLYQGRNLPEGTGRRRIPKGGSYLIAAGHSFHIQDGEFPLYNKLQDDLKAAHEDKTPFRGGAVNKESHERILAMYEEAYDLRENDR